MAFYLLFDAAKVHFGLLEVYQEPHLYLTVDPPNPGSDFVPTMPFQEVLEIMRETDKVRSPDLRSLDKHILSFESSNPLRFVYQQI